MTLASWLRARFNGGTPPADPVATALEVAAEVARKARELRDVIEPYAKLDDPFIALWKDHYEARQEARIHLGPKK